MLGKTKIILCSYNKGGVGKTTLAVHITGVLLEQGKGQVLLVDCDPRPDSWRFYKGKRPQGQELRSKINSRLDILWNPPQDKGEKFKPIKKADLQAYDYIVIDTDSPPEDTVIMINNNLPDIILIPINKSQRHSLDDIPDFLELLKQVKSIKNSSPNVDYSPKIIIVPLGVNENEILRLVPDADCEIAKAMRNIQDQMVDALGEKRYIWKYQDCEDSLEYFSSLLEMM
jgi:chromosome partitioning protein